MHADSAGSHSERGVEKALSRPSCTRPSPRSTLHPPPPHAPSIGFAPGFGLARSRPSKCAGLPGRRITVRGKVASIGLVVRAMVVHLGVVQRAPRPRHGGKQGVFPRGEACNYREYAAVQSWLGVREGLIVFMSRGLLLLGCGWAAGCNHLGDSLMQPQ